MAGIGNREASQHRFVYVGDGWSGKSGDLHPMLVRGRFFYWDAALLPSHLGAIRLNSMRFYMTYIV